MICCVERHQKAICKVILQQALLGIITTTIVFSVYDSDIAKSIIFGFVVAIVNTVMILWRMWQSERAHHNDANKYLRMVYRSSFERLLIVAMLIAIGMGPAGLKPVALLIGFALGQLTLIVSQIMRGIKSN